ncbi:NUDIX domain-containing protein [Candidatus Dojkabacteria bacterium]|uniref:Oxidized purine nucleoside triphosphate hydrolase n=1 Tax=Candidatus Dojkabacteria bacterium TaxID=2099670 RepID=A0A955L065_9BACT|nr:NUDIX domain-containing protein [Candidatus Dojkabacteria bacterium]
MTKIDEYLKKDLNYVQAVAGFMVKDGKVLLGKRKKVSNDLGKDLYAGIGGKVDGEESTDECLEREILEEIGVKVTKYQKFGQLKYINPHNPQWDMEGHFYLITKWSGKPEESEVIKPIWFNLDEIPRENMFSDNKYWLDLLFAGKSFEGVFLFGSEKSQVEEYRLIEI